MPSDVELLAFLGVDAATLDPAPADPCAPGWRHRVAYGQPSRRGCCSCRALAVATRIVSVPGLGRRWHDQCRDCMIASMRQSWDGVRPMEGRYRVTLIVAGVRVIQGWWDERSTADDKFTRWIGQHGSRPGARVVVTDEETDIVVKAWPTEPTA
ncbi:hypothetical protein KMT30_04830 [Streptomyces sp. IBSBF 2953]|nr:hypothetical protein [Streptomyces hayashii]MCQ9178367.1 hypothetical protein [Streptomyces hayashii]